MKLLQTLTVYGIYFTGLLLAGNGHVSAATGVVSMERYKPATERIMSCEAPVEFSDRHRIAGLELVSDPEQSGPVISLIRLSEGHYDLRVGDDSMTALGKLTGVEGDLNPVHLVLETRSDTEHFLFMQNPDGTGELLWSSATASALTTCIAADL